MVNLGVNIDHVATIRQARRTFEPDPVWAASLAIIGGADSITVHLREDRRHIQDRDLDVLKQTIPVKLNLECACVDEMLAIACQASPQQVCLVPERREEITTEGGLDVVRHQTLVKESVSRLKEAGIHVSVFVDADNKCVEICKQIGADAVELHTGAFANSSNRQQKQELEKLRAAGKLAREIDLEFHAGHGLNYYNVHCVAGLPGIQELNIGHSIISRSVFVGITEAVREMKSIIVSAASEK
jgi:pyridoxine 5-phosphate synthase